MIHGKEELLPRVTEVEVLEEYVLLLTFNNGEKKTFDVSPLLTLPAYQSLSRVFDAARVEYGTVVWPGEIDISPDKLYLQGVPVSG